jgi:hypothetical protein
MDQNVDDSRGLRQRLYHWTGQKVNQFLDKGHSDSSQSPQSNQWQGHDINVQTGQQNDFPGHHRRSDHLQLHFDVSDTFSLYSTEHDLLNAIDFNDQRHYGHQPCYCLHTDIVYSPSIPTVNQLHLP